MSSVPPTGLKHRSVVVMIVLILVTLGLYYPIWFLRRRAALNRLDSPRKLQQWPFLLSLSLVIVDILLAFAAGPAGPARMLGAGTAALLLLARLAVGIVLVVQCFFIKDILEDHLAGPGDSAAPSVFSQAVSLSALMTFFFQIFYQIGRASCRERV